MKRKFFTLIFIFFLIFIDSFAFEKDSIYNFLDTLSYTYIRARPDTVANKLLSQINKVNYAFYKAKIYAFLGFEKYIKLKIDSAEGYLAKIDSSLLKKIKDDKKRATILLMVYRMKAFIFHQKRDILMALKYYNMAMKEAKKLNDMKMVSSLLSTVGILNLKIGNIDEALYVFFEALNINKNINVQEGMAWDYYLIAKSYMKSGKIEKSLDFANRSIDLYLQLAKSDSTFFSGVLLGSYLKINMFLNNKDYKKAVDITKKILEYSSFVPNNKIIISDVYFYAGKVYFNTKNYNLAEQYLKRSLRIRESIEHHHGIGLCHYFLAKLYNKKGEYNLFIKHLDMAKEEALKGNYFNLLKDIYSLYIDWYVKNKKYKDAFEVLNKYNIINDSLMRQELNNKLAGFNVKYAVDKIKLENTSLKDTIAFKDKHIILYKFMLGIIIVGMLILVFLIIRQRKLNKEIARLSNEYYNNSITDKLTGVYNRTILYEIFEKEISRAMRYDFSFSIIIFDIDDFKLINDTYGHLIGDYVLKEIANIINNNIRKEDYVIRFGGEEFLVMLPQIDKKSAQRVAEKILMLICNKDFVVEGKNIRITISGGVSEFDKSYINSAELMLKSADKALYKAKEMGKNRVIVA